MNDRQVGVFQPGLETTPAGLRHWQSQRHGCLRRQAALGLDLLKQISNRLHIRDAGGN